MAVIWVGTGRFNAYIGPVQDYIDRVVAADVAAGNTLGLEVGVRDAYDVFIRDSINVGDLGTSGGVLSQANSIIKAAPILAGARTLSGCLVPLVGTAPTRLGTADGWNYDRKTGLAANGTNNYINSGRAGNADPQNNTHCAVNVHTANSTGANAAYAGDRGSVAGAMNIGVTTSSAFFRCRAAGAATFAGAQGATGLIGVNRSSSTAFVYRINNNTTSVTATSDGVSTFNAFIFARNNGSGAEFLTNGRINFYSIGQSLDLALLDARVTTLINAIAAAIP
jgi:hypothetical protein